MRSDLPVGNRGEQCISPSGSLAAGTASLPNGALPIGREWHLSKSGSQSLRPATSVTGERSKKWAAEPGKNDRLTQLGWAFFPHATGFEIALSGATSVREECV
jgi:hypothetical protein